MFPCQYIVHLKTNFCPLDAQAMSDLKDHYNRGVEPNKQLPKFSNRLDQEQDNLTVDGIVISNDDKFNHYFPKIYNSVIFSTKTLNKKSKTVQECGFLLSWGTQQSCYICNPSLYFR